MNQEPQEGMIPKGRGKYLALAAVGVMIAIGIGNTRNQTKSPQGKAEAEAVTGSGRNQPSGRRNYETPQRQTEKEVTVRLAGCILVPAHSRTKYAGAWLCDRTGGDSGTARWAKWMVRTFSLLGDTELTGGSAAGFNCPAGSFAQGGGTHCTAMGSDFRWRTFMLKPVR